MEKFTEWLRTRRFLLQSQVVVLHGDIACRGRGGNILPRLLVCSVVCIIDCKTML